MDPPNFLLPATICHEMAHQIGYASETEANYLAFMACWHHPDVHYQYSGMLLAMRYSLRTLYRTDTTAHKRVVATINQGILTDLKASRKYWSSFYNPFDEFTDWFYDLFLKANSQKDGIKSYGLMVKLLLGEYRKNGLTQ